MAKTVVTEKILSEGVIVSKLKVENSHEAISSIVEYKRVQCVYLL